MKIDGLTVVILVGLLILAVFWGGIFYIAYHFITKFW